MRCVLPVLISIHALLAESDPKIRLHPYGPGIISIHALLAESDVRHRASPRLKENFYPRSPCGERPAVRYTCVLVGKFLSTLSLRRATGHRWIECRHPLFLSTLSLRRATPARQCYTDTTSISIHALLAESDFSGDHGHINGDISIHALLAESDPTTRQPPTTAPHFYPRSPCGERLLPQPTPRPIPNFYPRSPCGERLLIDLVDSPISKISIHALLAESDVAAVGLNLVGQIFLSTLSLRRATTTSKNR